VNINTNVILKEKEVEKVLRKRSLIDQFKNAGVSINQFARNNGVAVGTLHYLIQKEKLGLSALVDGRTTKKKSGTHITNDCIEFLISHQTLFPRCPLTTTYQQLVVMGKKMNWPIPSYAQVTRLFRTLPGDMRTMLFENSRVHFQEWGLVPRNNQQHINQEWQIDFSEMKLWSLDIVTGELFRPYVTNIIDGFTRICVATVIHRKCPTAADTLLVMRKAILPKDIDTEPFYGIPEHISTDNGSVYSKSADFMDALLRLNIMHRDIPNNSPASNGKVERMFRTFEDGLCKKLHGYSSQFRGLEKAKNTAIPFPVLQKLIDQFRLEYHTREHSELATTPWEKWHHHIMDATNLVFDPTQVINACKVRKDSTVERDGVNTGELVKYSSGKLAGLVGKKVTLRLLPEGHDPAPECYYEGALIDLLKPQGGLKLAEEISNARLERVEEIRQLRKDMKSVAEQIIHPQGAVKHGMLPTSQVSSPTTPEEPLGPVEKLKPTDEEE